MRMRAEYEDYGRVMQVNARFKDWELMEALNASFLAAVRDRLVDSFMKKHEEEFIAMLEEAMNPEEVLKIVSKAAAHEISKRVVAPFDKPKGAL